MTTAGASKGYDSLFGSFGLRENPFHLSPDPRFLFSGQAYQTAIAELMFGVQSRRGLHVLTGEAGTGKTTLLRYFLQWLAERRYSSSYVFHSHLASAELFEFVLRDFGVPVESSKKTDLIAALQQWLLSRQGVGDTPVLIIDEAQALSIRTLSELRLLLNLENSNGKLLQIILAGQPELVEKLHRPELSALRQRMMAHCRLPVLTLEDTTEYIDARLRGAGASDPRIFSPETVQTLYSFARGIPRVTNLLCERAMSCAYAERHTVVSPANVRKVAAEYDLEGDAGSCDTIDLLLPPRSSETAAAKVSPLVRPAPIADRPTISASARTVAPSTAPLPAPPTIAPAPSSPVATTSTLAPAVWFAPTPAPAPQTLKPKDKQSKEFIVEFRLDSAQQQELPKIVDGFDWRKYRPENPFKGYWSEISRDFRRDARALYLAVAPGVKSLFRKIRKPGRLAQRPRHSPSLGLQSLSGNLRLQKLDVRRKLFEPLASWLRRPLNTNRTRTGDSVPRTVRSGKV